MAIEGWNGLRWRHRVRCGMFTAIAAAGVAAGPPGAAAAERWTVVEGSGSAVHHAAGGGVSGLQVGEVVAEGDSVETGPNGHYVLEHQGHADRISVSPNTRFMVAPHQGGSLADIVQSSGALLFNVEHTPGRRFEVDGPYLAAVVKGTSFTVAIGASGSTVDVSQGVVQVQSPISHQTVLVGAGQSAAVSASGRHQLSLGARHGAATPPGGKGYSDSPSNPGQSKGAALSATVGETHLDVGKLTNNLVTGIAAPGAAAPTGPTTGGSAALPGGAGGSAGASPANGPALTIPGVSPVTGGVLGAVSPAVVPTPAAANSGAGSSSGGLAAPTAPAVPGEPQSPPQQNHAGGTPATIAAAAPTVQSPATPPAQTTVPPGQAATPPGQATTPPGQAAPPPGQAATPPGQAKTPPGQASTPPGQAASPPGQAATPPGQAATPPGQAATPPGQSPPGQPPSPPGQPSTPPGQSAKAGPTPKGPPPGR